MEEGLNTSVRSKTEQALYLVLEVGHLQLVKKHGLNGPRKRSAIRADLYVALQNTVH